MHIPWDVYILPQGMAFQTQMAHWNCHFSKPLAVWVSGEWTYYMHGLKKTKKNKLSAIWLHAWRVNFVNRLVKNSKHITAITFPSKADIYPFASQAHSQECRNNFTKSALQMPYYLLVMWVGMCIDNPSSQQLRASIVEKNNKSTTVINNSIYVSVFYTIEVHIQCTYLSFYPLP